MNAFETMATVEAEGHVRIEGVPFAPGTQVEVTISPKRIAVAEKSAENVRARMAELFQSVKGFRMSPKIPREDLYDRGSIR